jgi:hypothetical protein
MVAAPPFLFVLFECRSNSLALSPPHLTLIHPTRVVVPLHATRLTLDPYQLTSQANSCATPRESTIYLDLQRLYLGLLIQRRGHRSEMVTTRRSSARKALAAKTQSEAKITTSGIGTINVVKSFKKPTFSPSGSPDRSHDSLRIVCAESDSGLPNLSSLPPSTGNTPEKIRVHTRCSPKHGEPPRTTRTQTPVLEPTITSNIGSARNPISLLESPPPKHRSEKRNFPEPHKFLERHRKLSRHTQTLSRMPSRSANRSTFTSDLRVDMEYDCAREEFSVSFNNGTRSYAPDEVAYQRQDPSPTQFTMQRPRSTNYLQRQHSEYEAGNEPLVSQEGGYRDIHGVLRRSRADKTSAFNPTTAQLSQLTACNATLMSFLQAYPYSSDPERLRADISTLASVQNRCVQDWVRTEAQTQRKRSSDSAIDLSSDPEPPPSSLKEATKEREAEREKRKEQDDTMRAYFSSHADMWQDGTGTGVADVFGSVSTASLPAYD